MSESPKELVERFKEAFLVEQMAEATECLDRLMKAWTGGQVITGDLRAFLVSLKELLTVHADQFRTWLDEEPEAAKTVAEFASEAMPAMLRALEGLDSTGSRPPRTEPTP